MKKNGFTLVELLAVLALIAIVGVIATVSTTTVKSKIDKSMFEKTLQIMVISAKQYGEDNFDIVSKNTDINGNQYISVNLSNLKSDGFYDDSGNAITNYKNRQALNYDAIVFKIEKKNNRISACISQIANNATTAEMKDDLNSDAFCK